MKDGLRKNWLNIFLVILTILIVYIPILFKYFEQDEWFDYGSNQIYLHETFGFFGGLVKTIFSFLPFTQTINYLNYHFFGVQNIFPALVVLVLVLSNSILWISNLRKFKVPQVVIFGSLLFGYLSHASHQAVTWVMPSIATQSAFLFINLSIWFTFILFETKKVKYSLLILFFLVLSVSAKVNSFFIFAAIPILLLILNGKKEMGKSLFKVIIFALFLILSAIVYITIQPRDFKIGAGRYLDSEEKVFVNVFIIPTKSISQILVSDQKILLKFSHELFKHYYDISDQNTIDVVGVETISVVMSLLIIIVILFSVRKSFFINRANQFFLIFYFLSFLPYTLDKFSTAKGFLESRYYYLGTFSLGFLLFSYFFEIYPVFTKIRSESIKKILTFLAILLITLYFSWNIFLTERFLFNSIELTQKRKEILSFTKNEFIVNDNKNFILYIEDINYSDKNLSNVTGTFFQTGFMYPFLVSSYNLGKFDKSVFDDRFFWDMNFQGVLNKNGYKVGLFYDYNLLIDYLKNNNFNLDDLYSLTVDYKKATKNNAQGAVYNLVEATYSNTTEILKNKVINDK